MVFRIDGGVWEVSCAVDDREESEESEIGELEEHGDWLV